jgi:predicted NUDIX family NTP pyrophosphohydrolase
VRTSAGLLLFRMSDTGAPEVLLVHPGGPFWARKDAGAWSIPKGEYDPATDTEDSEDPADAAVREFTEELGSPPPPGDTVALGSVRQSSAKTVTAFARRGDFDAETISSNTISIPWPPKSGRMMEIPEVDRAQWCGLELARTLLVKGQVPFLDRLLEFLPLAETR